MGLLILLAVGAGITLLAILGVIGSAMTTPAEAPAPEPLAPERLPPARTGSPAAKTAPMVVTEMRSRGYFSIEDASGKREEPLPESPLGHGEFPMGLWVSPAHTVHVVGKLYTGRPGPDDGVVWKRTRDGTWSIALRLPSSVIGHVTGRSDDEVVGGRMGGIVCFDGQTWHEQALPYSMMWKVWSEGPDLVAQAFDGSATYTVSMGLTSMTAPRTEPRVDRYSFERDGIVYRIFDRSTPVGERTLDPREEAEIKRELAQVQKLWADGKAEPPRR